MRLILGIRCIRQVKSPHTVCACHHGYITLASVSIIGCVNLMGIITLAPEPADGVKTAMSGTFRLPCQSWCTLSNISSSRYGSTLCDLLWESKGLSYRLVILKSLIWKDRDLLPYAPHIQLCAALKQSSGKWLKHMQMFIFQWKVCVQ